MYCIMYFIFSQKLNVWELVFIELSVDEVVANEGKSLIEI